MRKFKITYQPSPGSDFKTAIAEHETFNEAAAYAAAEYPMVKSIEDVTLTDDAYVSKILHRSEDLNGFAIDVLQYFYCEEGIADDDTEVSGGDFVEFFACSARKYSLNPSTLNPDQS